MSKISELSDGGALQSTDYLIAVRSGGNVKVQLSELPSGIGAGGNIVFGDNEKAIFGAGSDLQIYHDGFNSYVEDTGDGALFLKTNGAGVFLYSGSEALATFNLNGASNLYYDNGLKLSTTSTGIDVTGTVTATTALEVSSGVPYIDWTDTATTDEDTRAITFNGDFYIGTINDAKTTTKKRFLIDHSTGDISFYEDTGTTPKFFWDASAERLGLGTTSPTVPLHIVKAASGVNQATDVLRLSSVDTDTSYYVGFQTQRDNSAGMGLNILTTNVLGTVSEAMRITPSGSLLVGTTDDNVTNNGTEAGAGINLGTVGVKGFLSAARWQGSPAVFNRMGNDGEVVYIFKDGNNVGSISADAGGTLMVGTSTANLNFRTDASQPRVIPRASVGSASDGLIDLGDSGSRFKDLYLSGTAVIKNTAGTYTIDSSNATVVAASGTVGFANASGMLIVNNHNTGHVSFYLAGGGSVTHIGSSGGTQVGTFTYTVGNNGYTFTNNSGSSYAFGFCFIRTRNNA